MSMQWWKVSIFKQNFPYFKTKYLSIKKIKVYGYGSV